VAVPHRAVVRLVKNTNYLDLGPADVVAQASSSTFDAATFEIWGALLNGAKLAGVGRESLISPDHLADRLRDQSVSVLFLTTALFNQLVREAPQTLGGVKQVLFGGEAAEPKWVRVLLERGGPERLLHVYGPTETTTFATWQRVEEVNEGATTVPIGRPLANGELYVLDAALRPVPVGVAGELYIGGDGLARCYWNRPELTAERFVPHPWSERPGARLYRTGDLVRYREDGAVEFVGRVDQQVKLRGFRVELGEVEAVLSTYPGVASAVVLLREDEPGEKLLVAYLTPKETVEALRSGELRDYVKGKLPEYMVPSAFVVMQALPLTAHGKVDRKALPAPERGVLNGEFVAPRTDVERALAEIFSKVLRVDRVGVHDNFFELGGHSLLVTQVVSRLRDEFRIDVPLRSLFDSPSVAGLGVEIELLLQRRAGKDDTKGAEREEGAL
jgi:acyl-coenzyme A synthetase/AMP-(fatty) acid ligase/acyl carrier protein